MHVLSHPQRLEDAPMAGAVVEAEGVLNLTGRRQSAAPMPRLAILSV